MSIKKKSISLTPRKTMSLGSLLNNYFCLLSGKNSDISNYSAVIKISIPLSKNIRRGILGKLTNIRNTLSTYSLQ